MIFQIIDRIGRQDDVSNYAIEVNELEKRFGGFVAVDKVSFNVEKGKIFGFLGANGAGKSTTIRMLCGLLSSTSGTATVAGYDINSEPEKIKENIGYMSQKFSLYEDLTVKENITFFGGAYGLSNSYLEERMKWIIDTAALSGMENSLTRDIPVGWKQRLALGCAILHEPKIVFLDEPTSGVDPVSRRNFWELINIISDHGATVFVTTHYLDEAEYCNNIVLIHAGRLVAAGSPRELKSKYITHTMYEIECSDTLNAAEILRQDPSVRDTSIFGNYVHIGAVDDEGIENRIRQAFSQKDIDLKRIEPIVPSLEDVFIASVK